MNNIDSKFIIVGILYLVAAMVGGLAMGADHGLAPVHGHAALIGGVQMMLFGLVYQAYPAMAKHGLAVTHFWIANTGALIFFGGQWIAIRDSAGKVATFGAILIILSLLMFLLIHLRARRG